MAIKSWNEMRKLDISQYVKQRDKADYLPWSDCLKLLYDNGAEKVLFETLTDVNGSSLFMSHEVFTDKNGGTNRCYEVRIKVTIDDQVYLFSYPVMNGINPVKDNSMNQNAVHKAQMRAFVKCVAINTGLGFNLWLDDSDIDDSGEDMITPDGVWNCPAIDPCGPSVDPTGCGNSSTAAALWAFCEGMTTKEIAEKLRTNESTINYMLTKSFDDLVHFEKDLSAL